MTASRETWPCQDCGHKHYAHQDCPDHRWTDRCPYEGLSCPPDAAEQHAAEVSTVRATFGPDATLDDILPPADD